MVKGGYAEFTYNLLAHSTVSGNLLTLGAAKLLHSGCEGLVDVILTSCARRTASMVGVVHFCEFKCEVGFARM
jgi:hypothetical protein